MSTKGTKTKKKTQKIKDVVEVAKTETVVVFKATKPLTQSQHEALSERVRIENEKSGVKVVLAPNIVDKVEVE